MMVEMSKKYWYLVAFNLNESYKAVMNVKQEL